MAIADGETAGRQIVPVLTCKYEGDREALRGDLLAYCRLDTIAMVRILGVLEENSGAVRPIAERSIQDESLTGWDNMPFASVWRQDTRTSRAGGTHGTLLASPLNFIPYGHQSARCLAQFMYR